MMIMLVVLLVFGAKRLPEMGASIGKGLREFKRSLTRRTEAIMGPDEAQRKLAPRQTDAQNQHGLHHQPLPAPHPAFDPVERSSPPTR